MTTERRPVLITVAPVGTHIDAPSRNPLTPEEVAQEVIACAAAGAGMVHLHVRDRQGQQTEELSEFSRTLDLIREVSDIVIQGSTGGVTTLTRDERCVSLNDDRVEVASLNMGSANVGEGVYINTLPDIRFWAGRMLEQQVVPELEVFEAGMLSNIPRLVKDDLLSPPFHCNFVLGFEGPLPAEPINLFFLQAMLPNDSSWGVIHDGMHDFRLLAAAIGMGASGIRVGFEDSVYYAPGQVAITNAELVTYVVELVQNLGCRAATPDESRKMLGIHA